VVKSRIRKIFFISIRTGLASSDCWALWLRLFAIILSRWAESFSWTSCKALLQDRKKQIFSYLHKNLWPKGKIFKSIIFWGELVIVNLDKAGSHWIWILYFF
jgi:hypothetical protein